MSQAAGFDVPKVTGGSLAQVTLAPDHAGSWSVDDDGRVVGALRAVRVAIAAAPSRKMLAATAPAQARCENCWGADPHREQ